MLDGMSLTDAEDKHAVQSALDELLGLVVLAGLR